jgi:hypothetical protein
MACPFVIPTDAVDRLRRDGYFIAKPSSCLDALDAIEAEIAIWKKTPAINGFGCIAHSGDALLQNVALYSPAALRFALSDEILTVVDAFFGQPAVLGKIEYRRSLKPKMSMPLHTDGKPDASLFIYLDGVDKSRGSTFVIPGTQKIGMSKNHGTLQVPEDARREFGGPEICVEGGRGTCLFMDDLVWHGRTETEKTGREILWLNYVKEDRAAQGMNLVYTANAVRNLTPRQYRAIGIGSSSPRVGGSEEFRLSRNLELGSLDLLPQPYLWRVVGRRIARSVYERLPPPVRGAYRWLRSAN